MHFLRSRMYQQNINVIRTIIRTFFGIVFSMLYFQIIRKHFARLRILNRAFLPTYCVRYPQAVHFFRNEITYSLLKITKPHAIQGSGCSIPNGLDLEKLGKKLRSFIGLYCPFFVIPLLPLHACLYFLEQALTGLISKLKRNRIFGNLLQVLHNLLNNRKQKLFCMENFLCEKISAKECLRVLF